MKIYTIIKLRKIGPAPSTIIARGFKKSSTQLIDANNGRDLDNTQEIADAFRNNAAGLENYETQKTNSINRDYRLDSNSAAASGVPASELDG